MRFVTRINGAVWPCMFALSSEDASEIMLSADPATFESPEGGYEVIRIRKIKPDESIDIMLNVWKNHFQNAHVKLYSNFEWERIGGIIKVED